MRTVVKLGVVVVAQAALVAAGVVPQLSARLTGDSHLFQVEPVDPIDPFRGAYVTLGYPDVRPDGTQSGDAGQGAADERSGAVYITLAERDGVMVAQDHLRERPDSGTYLACEDTGWQVRCGIESWFLPQDEAAEMERVLRDGAVAEVRIDGRGNAAVVDVRAE